MDKPNSLYRILELEPPYPGELVFRAERNNRLTTLTVTGWWRTKDGTNPTRPKRPLTFYLSDGELHTLIEYLRELEDHINT